MRWNKPKTLDVTKWHDWFAWYPVVVYINGKETNVWLETVARKGHLVYGSYAGPGYLEWEYRI